MSRIRVFLTPELAKEYLEKNYCKNRKLNIGHVKSLAEDIKNGNWNQEISKYDQPISISCNGELINGQHRCNAVIEANKPIYTWVETDVPIEMYDYFDCAKVRSASDIIDVPNAKNIAALARVAFAVERGGAPLKSAIVGKRSTGVTITRQEIVNFVKENSERLNKLYNESANASAYVGGKKVSMAIAIYILRYTGNDEFVEEFLREMSVLVPDAQQCVAARSYISSMRNKKELRNAREWFVSCILYTYDKFQTGENIKCFNKLESTFKKYDAFVEELRTKNE